ncbi:2-keto-3-deoxy-L-rhamnonate aldolase-like [Olea europaea subsp. europaea]|uniref:2-keto-3-deoxy-L-rhamnonate aldolase-like n=1 Tax=Olea europaea subsp. europaea TaxID=158383 RepID=A0A8S0PWW3_OLEEU|nr:2-keto-3-deoxy-L-rhamnonate aldolase-like [Olea europaea subsp. europaea]
MASVSAMKSRLHKGDTLYGLFLCSFSPVLAEITGYAGYDFVVVDMEHGHGGISDALPCLHALSATATPAILRLPECSSTWAKKALDLGPQGLMFPMIDNPYLAQQAVSYCRYPPNGIRGAAHPIIRASKYGIDEEYLTKCENDLFIMCQVESMEGLRNVKEIASVDGVDCIQIGPLDLSASMGQLLDPVNEKVKSMMSGAEEAVIGLKSKKGNGSNGPYLAGFAMPNDGPNELRARGYDMVSGGVDIGLYRNAALDDVKKFKMGLNLTK